MSCEPLLRPFTRLGAVALVCRRTGLGKSHIIFAGAPGHQAYPSNNCCDVQRGKLYAGLWKLVRRDSTVERAASEGMDRLAVISGNRRTRRRIAMVVARDEIGPLVR